jgi:uncharacterized membrane protein YedE/YeeE
MEARTAAAPRPFINPYVAGVLLGFVLFGAFALTHSGLGASGAISRVQIAATSVVSQSHVDRVGYFAALGGGDRKVLDNSGVIMLLGTFAGGLASSLRNKRAKVEVCRGPRIGPRTRIAFALLGGAIMGYGARFARGCTSGQALSGGAVLSAGSWVFMFSIFASAYALAYFVRKLWT